MKQIIPYDKNNPITNYFLYRMYEDDQNNIAIFTGKMGSGKSMAALKFAEELDPSFNVDKVVFTPQAFLDILQGNKLQRGNVVIFEEVGVGYSSRLFWSGINQGLNFVLQTFRTMNITVLMTTPNLSFIDITARKLMHFLFEMRGVNKKDKCSIAKPFKIVQDMRRDKIYYKYLTIPNTNDKINKMFFYLPSEELQATYLEKRKKYTDEIKQRMNVIGKKIDMLGKKKPTEKEIEIYKEWKAGKTQKELAKNYNTYQMDISRMVNKGKNYFFEEQDSPT